MMVRITMIISTNDAINVYIIISSFLSLHFINTLLFFGYCRCCVGIEKTEVN